jgi:hypothetical protein
MDERSCYSKAILIIATAYCCDLSSLLGKSVSEGELEELLRRAARRVGLGKEYEKLRPYIFQVGRDGHFFEPNPGKECSGKRYIIR